MARLPRPDLAGIPQHVVQRGNNRLPCFLDDEDRQHYLQCLLDALLRFGCPKKGVRYIFPKKRGSGTFSRLFLRSSSRTHRQFALGERLDLQSIVWNSDKPMGREYPARIHFDASAAVIRKIDHIGSGGGYHLEMRPITDIRRKRLRQMIDDVAEGNQARFAEMIKKSRAYVGFWLTDPAKVHAKQIGHTMAREVEAEMRRRGFGQYATGWLDSNVESQAPIPDIDRLGHALTSMDKVIRGKGLVMEGQLGKFRGLLAYAYALQDNASLFPDGINDETTRSERNKYDALVSKQLGGMIENGTVEVAGKVAPNGVKRAVASKAKSKKAGSR